MLGHQLALLQCTPSLKQEVCSLNAIDRAVKCLLFNGSLSQRSLDQLARQRELTVLKVKRFHICLKSYPTICHREGSILMRPGYSLQHLFAAVSLKLGRN